MATALKALSWFGEDVCLGDVDSALARLRGEAAAETASMRTSVMTHIAWVPEKWVQPARWSYRRLSTLNWLGLRSQRAKKFRLAFHSASAVRNNWSKA